MNKIEQISARQMKAARVLLDWSQSDFAKATGISIATIRRLEAGYITPRSATVISISKCLEAAGIEFLESDGVRRRPCGLNVFEGQRGGKDFLDDVTKTVQAGGRDILIVTPSADDFARYCGLQNILDLKSLLEINGTTTIKCLLTGGNEVPFSSARFQFRALSQVFINPVPFCAYGDKYGIAVPNGKPFHKLIVIHASKMACAAQQHFASLWEKATQISAVSSAEKQACG